MAIQQAPAYPFNIIAANGVGISHSSLNDIQSISAVRSFGQAQIECAVNAANGNLFLRDKTIQLPEVDENIVLSYVYNSQCAKPWRLHACRSILNPNPTGMQIVLEEPDGYQVVYHWDANTQHFVGPANRESIPFITYNDIDNTYSLTDPHTNCTEVYNASGQLIRRISVNGNLTEYRYDDHQELFKIIGPSGINYFIETKELTVNNRTKSINIYLDDQKPVLIHTYQFEGDRLKTSTTASGYAVNYTYDEAGKLDKCVQTDTSVLKFGIDAANKVNTITAGASAENIHSFSYNDKQFTLTDADENTISLTLTEAGKIENVIKENEVNSYEYYPNGQLKKVIYPDQSTDQFEYDPMTGMCTKHITKDGLITEFEYQVNHYNRPILIAQHEITKNKKLTTRFIYDDINAPYPMVKFEVAPAGKVTAYTRYKNGLIETKRVFKKRYENSHQLSSQSADLAFLEWTASNISASTLKCYTYKKNGLNDSLVASGNTEMIGETQNQSRLSQAHDIFGNITDREVKIGEGKWSRSHFAHNDRGQIETQILGYKTDQAQKTDYAYNDNTVKITEPNGRVESIITDSQHLLDEKTSEVVNTQSNQAEIRHHKITRSAGSHFKRVLQEDGFTHYEVYDTDGRLSATVSPTGVITTCEYNRKTRSEISNRLKNKIDIQLLSAEPNLLAQKSLIDQFISGNTEKKSTYLFNHINGKPQYRIDAELGLVEYQYDEFGNQIHQIEYKAIITSDELQSLKKGEPLKRIPNRQLDRVHSSFYDNEQNKLADQDPAGYITQYNNDADGTTTEVVSYNDPFNEFVTDYADLQPVAINAPNSRTYYFYNELNQRDLEVDAEGYITVNTYADDDLKLSSRRYKTKLTNPLLNASMRPAVNEKDTYQETGYEYDDLRRLKSVRYPSGRVEHYTNDVMNQRTHTKIVDGNDESNLSSDHCRENAAMYDGWGQVTVEANAYVMQTFHELKEFAPTYIEEKGKRSLHTENGLTYQVIDSEGNTTRFYYDEEKRPILTIDPTGIVIALIYNSDGDIEKSIHYHRRLDLATHHDFNGGYSPTILSELDNLLSSVKDRNQTFKYNGNRKIIEKVDLAGNIKRYHYNSFNEVDEEYLPVNEKNPTLIITHGYEQRGLEIETVKSTAGEVDIAESFEYKNRFGKQSKHTNTLGGVTQQTYDKLGREDETLIEDEDNAIVIIKKCEWDAYNRPVSVTNALGKTVYFDYDDQKRTVTTQYPDQYKVTVTQNIFQETIAQITSGNIKAELFTHSPDGKVETHTNSLNDTIVNTFDTLSRPVKTVNENKCVTEQKFNGSNQLTEITRDVGGLNASTILKTNVFDEVELTTDPTKLETFNDYNPAEQITTSVINPGIYKLNITTTSKLNSAGKLIEQYKGDLKHPNLYAEKHIIDGFNREIAVIVDPKDENGVGKNIETQFKHDADENIIKQTDPNGYITRNYFNKQKQKRFKLTPLTHEVNALTQWLYTPTGKVRAVINHEMPIASQDVNDATSFETMKSMAPLPTLKRYQYQNIQLTLNLYDDADKEKYKLEFIYDIKRKEWRAIVEEKVYDNARREVRYHRYAKTIPIKNWQTVTNEQVARLCKPSNKDRILYRFYDDASQERLTVDQDGRAVEKEFDKTGKNVIAETAYDNRIPNPDKLEGQPFQAVEHLLKPSEQDRKTYRFNDALNREYAVVKPNGGVIIKSYDLGDHLLSTATIKAPISMNGNYEAIKARVDAIVVDPLVDSVVTNKLDEANRIISVSDPLRFSDEYLRDALGNATHHLARNVDKDSNQEAQWTVYRINRANQLEAEESPVMSFVQVKYNPETKLLDYQTVTSRIVKKTLMDNAGNSTQIIQAFDLPDQRVFICEYNASNKLISTKVPHVKTDNILDQITSLNDLKEIETDVTTETLYDLNEEVSAERNEAGIWTFYVRNNIGQLLYQVTENVVIEYENNVFNEEVKAIKYALPFPINLKDYFTENEIPLKQGLVVDPLLIKSNLPPRHPDDKVTSTYRSTTGKILETKEKETPYYLDNEHYGYARKTTQYTLNTFDETIAEHQLRAPSIWAEKFIWRDQLGNIIATVDENSKVTLYERDVEGREVVREEFSTPLAKIPTTDMSLKELKSIIKRMPEDRKYEFTYNQNGDKTRERLYNVTLRHNLFIDGKFTSIVKHYDYLDKIWTYTPLQKIESITYEDGAVEQKFYNEAGIQIGETAVMRTQYGSGERIIPYSSYLLNAHGERAVTIKSDKGCTIDPTTQLPQFKSNDPEDLHAEVKLFDNRGLAKYLQNAENELKARTFTASKKQARELSEIKLWEKGEKNGLVYNFTQSTHLDEEATAYNRQDLAHLHVISRDNVTEEVTVNDYDTFQNVTTQAEPNVESGIINKWDTNNKLWFTNSQNGANSVILRDLAGNETLRLQAPNDDLSQLNYSEILPLLDNPNWDAKRLERNATLCDNHGRPKKVYSPLWHKDRPAIPTREYKHDVWHNVLEEYNSFGDGIFSTFNKMDKIASKTLPEILDYNDDNTREKRRISTLFAYNTRGVSQGTIDSKNRLDGYVLDEAGNHILHVLPSGLIDKKIDYNAYDLPVNIYDASDNCWKHDYFKTLQTKRVIFPTGKSMSHELNGKGGYASDISMGIDPAVYNFIIRYNSDARDNTIAKFLPGGEATESVYNRNHQANTIIHKNQDGIEDGRYTNQADFFSYNLSHIDMGGTETISKYNFNKRLTHQYHVKASDRQYLNVVKQYEATNFQGEYAKCNGTFHEYIANYVPVPALNLVNEYEYDNLTQTTDNALNQIIRNDYDTESLIKRELITSLDGEVIRDRNHAFDSWKRNISTTDKHMTVFDQFATFRIDTAFDSYNNKRSIKTQLSLPCFAATDQFQQVDEHLFTFDINNNVLINDGILNPSTGVIQIAPNRGIELTYENNLRQAERRILGDQRISTTKLSHDSDGNLKEKRTDELEEAGITNSCITLNYTNGISPDSRTEVMSHLQEEYRVNTVHHHNQSNFLAGVSADSVKTCATDRNLKTVSSATTFSNFYSTGDSKIQSTVTNSKIGDDHNSQTSTFDTTYLLQDGFLPSIIRGKISNKDGSNESISSAFYAPDLALNAKDNADDERLNDYGFNENPYVWFLTTKDQRLLAKIILQHVPFSFFSRAYGYTYFFDASGAPLGAYRLDYFPSSLIQDKYCHPDHTEESKPFVVPQNLIHNFTFINAIRSVGEVDTHPFLRAQPQIFEVDEHLNWDKERYPALGNTSYDIQFGDTFESIAAKFSGGVDFAARIAEVNARQLNDLLLPGRSLEIPPLINNKNNIISSRPDRDFLSTIHGSLFPHLTLPEPKDDGDDAIGVIIEAIVITIVLMIVAAWSVPTLIISTMARLSISKVVAVALVKAAAAGLADAAIQGIAVGLDIQKKFSVQEVIESAVTGGVNSYVAEARTLQAANGIQATADSITETVMRTAKIQVITQLGEMATGVRKRFDAGAIIAQVMGSVASSQIDEIANSDEMSAVLGNGKSAFAGAASSAANVLIGAGVRGTPPNVQAVVTQAIGGAVQGEIASSMAQSAEKSGSYQTKDEVKSQSNAGVGRDAGKPVLKVAVESNKSDALRLRNEVDDAVMLASSIQSSNGLSVDNIYGSFQRYRSQHWNEQPQVRAERWNQSAGLKKDWSTIAPSYTLAEKIPSLNNMYTLARPMVEEGYRTASMFVSSGISSTWDSIRHPFDPIVMPVAMALFTPMKLRMIDYAFSTKMLDPDLYFDRMAAGLKYTGQALWYGDYDTRVKILGTLAVPLMLAKTAGTAAGELSRLSVFGSAARSAEEVGGESARLIGSIERVPSNIINLPFITEKALAEGWWPPYPENLTLRKITITKETTFYRVHTDPTRPIGRFIAREKEIAPYLGDVEALRLHLGLPDVPIYITEVNVPVGATILTGRIGPQPAFGLNLKSGFQYQIVSKVPESNFVNTRPILDNDNILKMRY